VIDVAARLGQHVDLRGLVAKLGGINAGLHFELLKRVDGGKHDVGEEVGVGIVHAIEREVVEHDALSGGGNGLVGAVAAFAGARLSGGRRECIGVGGKSHKAEVGAPIEGQFDNGLVLDDGSDGGIFRLEEVGLRGDFDGFADLADLKSYIEADRLLNLHFDVIAGSRFEARVFGLDVVETRGNRGERIIAGGG